MTIVSRQYNAALRFSAVLMTSLALGSQAMAAGAGLTAGPGLGADPVRASLQAGSPYVSGMVLIQMRPNAKPADLTRVLSRVSGSLDSVVVAKANRTDARGDLVAVRTPLAIGDAMTRAQADVSVEFAEPNWIYKYDAVQANPNDPYMAASCLNNNVPCQWGLLGASTSPANPYGSGALAAWNNGAVCSDKIHVGVIDEGVMLSHPDLAANAWVNAKEIANNTLDDDRNGYINDINGWDFAGRNNTVFDGVIDDHGTHVAGTIAAATNNGAGVMGICGKAKIISAKFIGQDSTGAVTGTTANAIAAVNYITNLKLRQGLKIVATNNSWSGGGFSQSLLNAISSAGTANILFITAAGNNSNNLDVLPNYPASYKLGNMISVASIGPNGAKAGTSNYGANTVNIAAPGVGIVSTVPSSATTGGYAYYSGTSMAVPHVTGAAALYASLNPCATAAQIKAAILAKATFDPALVTYVNGGRRLNISGFKADLLCPLP